jgi:uncharacterized protein YdeI (YjbR/CyaY-like superfamily)
MTQETYKDQPVIFFATQAEWEHWLEKHFEDIPGAWLKFAKKNSGITSLNYDDALQVALCFGWIDGQTKSVDETYYLQKFTKRRPKGMWSKRNIIFIEQLTKAGKMRASGLAEVAAAKSDGRWDQAYDSPSNMTIPADFQAELDKYPKAKAFYATLNKTNTYAILWRIQTAKKPETRQARIEKLIVMLNEGKKIH